MKIKVARYIAEFLVEHGIIDCFMVTGGGAMHLNDALGHQEGLRCIFNHHEQACSIAAEGYTRMTGRLAAVCVTSGPGGTNAITGVMGGWLDSIPMFVLSGQVKRETTIWSCPELNLRQLGDQEFNIVQSVSNMTKYAVMITEPERIAYHLEKALFLAEDGRGGPVWLDIPLDVQGAMVETEELKHFDAQEEGLMQRAEEMTRSVQTEKSRNLEAAAQTILQKIREAKAPLILVGTGVRLGKAETLLLKLIDKLRIPVVTAWNANDTVAWDNPFFAGMPGTVGTRPGNFAVQNCDLLLSLGCRLNIRMIGYNRFDFAKNAYKIIVDIDPVELQKPTICSDMPVNADVKELLEAMLKEEYQPQEQHEAWTAWCRDLVREYPAVLDSYHSKLPSCSACRLAGRMAIHAVKVEDFHSKLPSCSACLNPYVFMEKLFEQCSDDERIICGNGSACVITFQACKIKQGQRMFTNSGCAAMGYGLPAALGVAVSDNSRRVVCIDGDGSVMMNIQELATIAYNHLNVKLFILNNDGYHSIRQTQTNLFKPPFVGIDQESGIGFPDFGKLSEAFGLRYFCIRSEEDCDALLQEVLGCEEACICEVMLDPHQNFEPKSSSKVMPDGKIVSPSLDDMAPFLDREEFDKIHYPKSER